MNNNQIERYGRNISLKEVGTKGQKKLLDSKVLVIGTGGLGSPAVLYLAAAGVGTIGLADCDSVNLSNIQRQIIHFTDDVGTPKVVSAEAKIKRLNPDVDVKVYHTRMCASNISQIIADYDFVIECTDNFPAKFLINDACVLNAKPYSYAGVLRFDGQTMTVLPHTSPCYRCVFIDPPSSTVPGCTEVGVLGGIPGIIGTIQAVEALKYLLGIGELLTGRLLVFEALEMRFREVKVSKSQYCPVCGKKPVITSLIDYEQTMFELKR